MNRFSMSIPRRRAFIVGLTFIWEGLWAYIQGHPTVGIDVGMDIEP